MVMNRGEVEDEKLIYLVEEVAKFMQFMIALGDDDEQYTLQIKPLELSKMTADFHDKYGSRYNKNQLVNQFIKKHLGGIPMVKVYSKVKNQLDGLFTNN